MIDLLPSEIWENQGGSAAYCRWTVSAAQSTSKTAVGTRADLLHLVSRFQLEACDIPEG